MLLILRQSKREGLRNVDYTCWTDLIKWNAKSCRIFSLWLKQYCIIHLFGQINCVFTCARITNMENELLSCLEEENSLKRIRRRNILLNMIIPSNAIGLVLDIGAGYGRIIRNLPKNSTISLDISITRLSIGNKLWRFPFSICADGCKLPFRAEIFNYRGFRLTLFFLSRCIQH